MDHEAMDMEIESIESAKKPTVPQRAGAGNRVAAKPRVPDADASLRRSSRKKRTRDSFPKTKNGTGTTTGEGDDDMRKPRRKVPKTDDEYEASPSSPASSSVTPIPTDGNNAAFLENGAHAPTEKPGSSCRSSSSVNATGLQAGVKPGIKTGSTAQKRLDDAAEAESSSSSEPDEDASGDEYGYDEDSNDEGNWRNEYPDSEEDHRKANGDDSSSDSDDSKDDGLHRNNGDADDDDDDDDVAECGSRLAQMLKNFRKNGGPLRQKPKTTRSSSKKLVDNGISSSDEDFVHEMADGNLVNEVVSSASESD